MHLSTMLRLYQLPNPWSLNPVCFAANSRSATASISVPIARRPACTAATCLAVSPSSGFVHNTSFTATASNFVADGALTYRFGAKLEGGREATFRSASEPQYTIKDWVLPVGEHDIVVCAQGESSLTSTSVAPHLDLQSCPATVSFLCFLSHRRGDKGGGVRIRTSDGAAGPGHSRVLHKHSEEL